MIFIKKSALQITNLKEQNRKIMIYQSVILSFTQFETDPPLIIVSKIWYHINIQDYYHCKIEMQNNDMDSMLQF